MDGPMRRLALAAVFAFFAASCSGSGAETPSTPFVTATPTAAASPTATQVPETVEVVLATLKGAGIPIGESVTYTAETDVNKLLGRPNGYVGKINFLDARITRTRPDSFPTEDGRSIEVFANADGAKARKDYIDALGKGSPTFVEYSYLKGRSLVRVSKTLTPLQAAEYETALGRSNGQ